MGQSVGLLSHLWTWGMRRCDNQLVLRGKNILHALECFHVHFVLAFGGTGDGLDEISVSLHYCVCWCHCWLCQVLVFEIYRVADSCPPCRFHKYHVRSIMFVGCSKVPSVTGVFAPARASCRLDVKLHSTSHGCKGHAPVVKLPMMVRVCADVGGDICRSEQIEGEYGLWNELIPFCDWKIICNPC